MSEQASDRPALAAGVHAWTQTQPPGSRPLALLVAGLAEQVEALANQVQALVAVVEALTPDPAPDPPEVVQPTSTAAARITTTKRGT